MDIMKRIFWVVQFHPKHALTIGIPVTFFKRSHEDDGVREGRKEKRTKKGICIGSGPIIISVRKKSRIM